MKTNCLVINLATADKRRLFMIEQLASLPGLEVSFFAAIDGRCLDEDELACLYDEAGAHRVAGHPLTRGEIGCALSHLGVYRRIVEEDLPAALVLEDDAWFGPGFPEALEASRLQLPVDQPRIILFTHVRSVSRHQTVTLNPGHRLCQVTRGAWLARAYLINQAAARILAKQLMPVRMPADYWSVCLRNGWTEVWAVVPYCISDSPEGKNHSTITPGNIERRGPALSWLARLRGRLNLGDRIRQWLGLEERQDKTW
jgi:glycosyl transferase family 25